MTTFETFDHGPFMFDEHFCMKNSSILASIQFGHKWHCDHLLETWCLMTSCHVFADQGPKCLFWIFLKFIENLCFEGAYLSQLYTIWCNLNGYGCAYRRGKKSFLKNRMNQAFIWVLIFIRLLKCLVTTLATLLSIMIGMPISWFSKVY